MGGIRRWKDGRNMPDVHSVLFDYGDLPVSMRLNLGTETPEVLRFHGSKGLLELTETRRHFTPQSGRDTAPELLRLRLPEALREAYVKKWHEENDPKPGQEPLLETVTFRGPSLRRHQAAPLELLRGGAHAAAGGRGRGLRPPRGAGLPHGQRVVLPQEHRVIRRRREEHQELTARGFTPPTTTGRSAFWRRS